MDHRRRRGSGGLRPTLLLPPEDEAGWDVPYVPGRGGRTSRDIAGSACYNPVSDGMVIETGSDKAKKAQEGVLELLLVNHPLDCPVCDKGGECPLQDQTLAYGPGESRFVEEKRHWEKPIAISDLVNLDRERCIQCGRCVAPRTRSPATPSSTSRSAGT